MTQHTFDPFDPAVRRNPYPAYTALRQQEGVAQVPGLGFVVSRHADVFAVLRDPELFSSAAMDAVVRRPVDFAPADGDRSPDPNAASLIGSDPPIHTRLRGIVNRGFIPRRISALEPRIRQIATALADRLATAKECDLVADFAVPLPVTVVAELLGIDRERHQDFKRWSDAMMRAVFDAPGAEEAAGITQCLEEMNTYLEEVIAARQRQPEDDLLTVLVQAETSAAALSTDEVKIFAFTLLVAGNVTTTHLIANATLALLAHPAELAKVTADRGLVPDLVEEALRYDNPVQLLFRTATRDTVLAGTPIPAGSVTAPLFASANRDERVFRDPDRFDISRKPLDHVAFGHGIHFCLGAALARLEARVAFDVLLARIRRPVLLEEEITWVDSFVMRGPRRLRLGFETATIPRRRVEPCEDPEALVRRFVAAWSRLDPEELADYFTDDATYHNVPLEPVTGRAGIEQLIRTFTASWTATDWQLRHVIAAGNVVIAERIDRTWAGDRSVALPIVGVFELERGKIKCWRDYFDLATYAQALG